MDSSVREGAACVGAVVTKNDMPDITVLMGPQGAGKGTQAHLLDERLKLPLVATGDILREMAHSDEPLGLQDRKSTRLNSSHVEISYAVFCLKKKTVRQRRLLSVITPRAMHRGD